MQTSTYIGIAGLLLAAAACGGHGHAGPAAEACEHMHEGPSETVTATDETAADPPDISASHTRFDVTLTGAGDSRGGWVDVASAEAGDLILFVDSDVPMKLWDGQGAEVPPESRDPVNECQEVHSAPTFEVDVGTYTLELGPTSSEVVRLVPERGDHAE